MEDSYTFFDNDGRVFQVMTGDYELGVICTATETGLRYVKGSYEGSAYWMTSENEIVPRPENPAFLDGNVLKDIPLDALLVIDGEYYPVEEGGEVTLDFNLPGVYKILLISFPYLDKEFEIDYQP